MTGIDGRLGWRALALVAVGSALAMGGTASGTGTTGGNGCPVLERPAVGGGPAPWVNLDRYLAACKAGRRAQARASAPPWVNIDRYLEGRREASPRERKGARARPRLRPADPRSPTPWRCSGRPAG
jgi:hypothetical protein